ncbi:GAF domain-containing sensor histidine kinase [Arthrobacter sp. GCM10027362]|uniref:sensor histidine kinase n=1 Tax=Arthrobacter sp. GCM10027362 TaxID=3273379 RepID=UPI00363293BF
MYPPPVWQSGLKVVDTDPEGNIRAMLAALASLAEDLSLETVLDRVAEAACRLAGARRGEIALAGGLNRPGSIVTIEIKQGRARRVPDRLGRPDGLSRPGAGAFLTVPIRVRGASLGQLHLADKAGAAGFSPEDEERTAALAALAGAAIENAMLSQNAAASRQWLEASMELAGTILGTMGQHGNDALKLIAERAVRESGSAVVAVGLPDLESGAVRWLLATGPGVAAVAGSTVGEASPILSLLESDTPRSLAEAAQVLGPAARGLLGPGLLVALGPRGKDRRVLLLARGPGEVGYPPWDVEMIGVFASHVSLALELAESYKVREQHLLFVDRERIARDLHDRVIQRLFAAGLNLQGMRRFSAEPGQLERIRDITSELDQIIRDLRDTIYSLREPAEGPELLSSRVMAAVREGTASLDYTPQLKISGPVDDVPPSVAEHVMAVVMEGLSNAVRHSGADKIWISLIADDHHRLELAIADNGRGIPAAAPRSGLANIESRARLLDGTFKIESAPGRGTKLIWNVPLP